MDTQTKIERNRRTWNQVSDLFIDASALPFWGPFGIASNQNLVGPIQGKSFLEIGCGSGRSIKYLTDRGAKNVYGLDISEVQIQEAQRHNIDAVKSGKVRLFRSAMEKKIALPKVDTIFSIYGVGWTQEPEKTFRNIYSYLKPGGTFIWSWDHSFFTDVAYSKGKFIVQYSYHDEKPIAVKDWKKPGNTAYVTYRKVETWFRLQSQAGFNIVQYLEPKPRNLHRAHRDPKYYYSIAKARKVPSSFIFVCQKPR